MAVPHPVPFGEAAHRFGGFALTGGYAQPSSAHTTPLREEFLMTVRILSPSGRLAQVGGLPPEGGNKAL